MSASLDETAWASPWRSHSVLERVLLTFGLGLCALLSPTWWVGLILLALVVLIALLIAQVPVRSYVLVLAAPWVFIFVGVLAIIITFGHASDALVSFGPLQITPASLNSGALIVTRALACTAAIMLLACTTPMSELLTGMRRIGAPGILVDIAASMYRMIFLLLNRARAISQAQRARLGHTNRKAAIRSTGQLLATIFVSSWDHARRLEAGLAGRGGTSELVAIRPANPTSPIFLTGICIALALAIGVVSLGWWLT